MLRYWRIVFNDHELEGQSGWLEFNDSTGDNRLLADDGTPITYGISYTTIDTNPAPPPWSS